MNKTKRIGIIVVLILIIGAFVLGPLLRSGGGKATENELPATFSFEENLAVSAGELVPIFAEVNSEDVTKIELIFNDSVFKTWENPKGKISFSLQADYFGIGAKSINLVSTLKSGQQYSDIRLIRILSDIAPIQRKLVVKNTFPHNTTHFTQGFEINNGTFYEGTGQLGQSKVMKINLATGNPTQEIGLDGNYFGEGITILGDQIFQLTWQNQKCLVYDKNTLQLVKDFPYTGEGWGICNDGTRLIMSDGSERIYFRNPKTFQIERTVEVYDNVGPRIRLNELEYIEGKIYANIWMLDVVLVIDPFTGKVLEELDGTAIGQTARGAGEVMNGIAYDLVTKKIYMTGKNWFKIAEVGVE
jgi:glutamine cyclotransferase